jgi:hypothetical protein
MQPAALQRGARRAGAASAPHQDADFASALQHVLGATAQHGQVGSNKLKPSYPKLEAACFAFRPWNHLTFYILVSKIALQMAQLASAMARQENILKKLAGPPIRPRPRPHAKARARWALVKGVGRLSQAGRGKGPEGSGFAVVRAVKGPGSPPGGEPGGITRRVLSASSLVTAGSLKRHGVEMASAAAATVAAAAAAAARKLPGRHTRNASATSETGSVFNSVTSEYGDEPPGPSTTKAGAGAGAGGASSSHPPSTSGGALHVESS